MNVRQLVLITILSMLLCACQREVDDELRTYIADVKARPGRPIEPIPDFKPLPKYTFPEHLKRRDPFAAIIKKLKRKRSSIKAPDPGRVKQELEQFPLDALTMVGTLRQGAKLWALVKGPKGTLYRVRQGDYMGKNYGKVSQITSSEIKLIETLLVSGEWQRRSTTLELN